MQSRASGHQVSCSPFFPGRVHRTVPRLPTRREWKTERAPRNGRSTQRNRHSTKSYRHSAKRNRHSTQRYRHSAKRSTDSTGRRLPLPGTPLSRTGSKSCSLEETRENERTTESAESAVRKKNG
eukprot:COSAG03_NODE_15085_length_441_cov_1.166667_2_plen_123_part_01